MLKRLARLRFPPHVLPLVELHHLGLVSGDQLLLGQLLPTDHEVHAPDGGDEEEEGV